MRKITIIFFLLICFPGVTYSHQGRTDSYGGHYNRSEGTYHYHSGEYAGTGEYTKPVEEGGTKITQESNTETSEKLVVNPDSSLSEIESLKTKINELEQQIQAKQNTIGKLNDELDEKNEKIRKLEDKSDEYLAIGFIIFITVIISYNIGKNKK